MIVDYYCVILQSSMMGAHKEIWRDTVVPMAVMTHQQAERQQAEREAQRVHAQRDELAERIARLMRRSGLAGCHRRRAFQTTQRNTVAELAPDLVRRAFTASASNQLWIADITYVPTGEGSSIW